MTLLRSHLGACMFNELFLSDWLELKCIPTPWELWELSSLQLLGHSLLRPRAFYLLYKWQHSAWVSRVSTTRNLVLFVWAATCWWHSVPQIPVSQPPQTLISEPRPKMYSCVFFLGSPFAPWLASAPRQKSWGNDRVHLVCSLFLRDRTPVLPVFTVWKSFFHIVSPVCSCLPWKGESDPSFPRVVGAGVLGPSFWFHFPSSPHFHLLSLTHGLLLLPAFLHLWVWATLVSFYPGPN